MLDSRSDLFTPLYPFTHDNIIDLSLSFANLLQIIGFLTISFKPIMFQISIGKNIQC